MTVNYLKHITEIYVFASADEGGEGVVGMTLPVNGRETFMPFVCADKERMEQLKPIAKKIAQESGKTIKLIKFKHRKEIETL